MLEEMQNYTASPLRKIDSHRTKQVFPHDQSWLLVPTHRNKVLCSHTHKKKIYKFIAIYSQLAKLGSNQVSSGKGWNWGVGLGWFVGLGFLFLLFVCAMKTSELLSHERHGGGLILLAEEVSLKRPHTMILLPNVLERGIVKGLPSIVPSPCSCPPLHGVLHFQGV